MDARNLGAVESTRSTESVRQVYDKAAGQPNPEWVRGVCPQCGEPVVSNCYYVGGKGYICTWECWASLHDPPTCGYRKVI